MDDASRLSDDDRGSVPKKQQEEHGNFGGIDSDTFMEGMEDIKDVKFGLEVAPRTTAHAFAVRGSVLTEAVSCPGAARRLRKAERADGAR